jgi:crotonobetainyl-CoA:carnitine CoA-transferase CaiB-like acyl-CoA transferase
MTAASIALEQLWSQAGGDPAALARATLTGADPILPTDFKIGAAASATIAATALAASEVWRLRTGRGQSVSVDLRAAVAAFKSERFLRVDGHVREDVRGGLFGFYRTSDGRFIQLHCAVPHHAAGIARFLGCEATRAGLAGAVER